MHGILSSMPSSIPGPKKISLTNRFRAATVAFFGYSPLASWAKRHPRTYHWLQTRLSLQQFTGLPLTIFTAVFCIAIAVLLGIIQDYLAREPLVAVDIRIANLLYTIRSASGLVFFYGVTLLAGSWIIITAAIALTFVLWWKRQRVLVFGLWLALIPSEGAAYLGKLLFHRGRPIFQAINEDSFSFPSGHATTVVAFYGFLAYLFLRRTRSWKTRAVVLLSILVLVALVDVSRLYLGVHYLSDVLAGNLIGLTGVILAVGVVEWFSAEKRLVNWSGFSLWYLAPTFFCIIAVAAALFWRAPALLTQSTRPPAHSVAASDIPSIFVTEKLPKYTETLLGDRQEPLNIIFVSKEGCFVSGLMRAGWIIADQASWTSVKRVFVAAFLNRGYPTAPMTPLFFNALPHDYGFEKETDNRTTRERHHARFWDTGYATTDGEVYVGTVSLDVGIKWGITHRIAPDIDTERDLLITDVETAGIAENKQIIPFVPPVLGSNFVGDPFFTDGKAAVLRFLPCG